MPNGKEKRPTRRPVLKVATKTHNSIGGPIAIQTSGVQASRADLNVAGIVIEQSRTDGKTAEAHAINTRLSRHILEQVWVGNVALEGIGRLGQQRPANNRTKIRMH